MTYELTAVARKQLRKLPASIQTEIINKIEFFLRTPDPLKFAQPIIGQKHTYRFRIRDYRVIFVAERNNLIIIKIGHRRLIYG